MNNKWDSGAGENPVGSLWVGVAVGIGIAALALSALLTRKHARPRPALPGVPRPERAIAVPDFQF